MESVALEPSQNAVPYKVKPHFNKENAKAYAAKAAEARKQAAIERQLAIERANEVAELPPDEVYRRQSLTRTRELIEKMEQKLERSGDPQAINYLSGSLAKLRDIEQKLANRPLPGSRRPGREKPARATPNSGPVDAE